MQIRHGWNKTGERITVLVASGDTATHWIVWSDDNSKMSNMEECRLAFGSMLTLANDLSEDIARNRLVVDASNVCRIRSFWLWQRTCGEFISANIVQLRAARRTITTPADFLGTTTTSFAELALAAVGGLHQSFWRLVSSPNEPIEQIRQAIAAGAKVCARKINSTDLFRLVGEELGAMFAHDTFSMRQLSKLLEVDNRTISPFIAAAGIKAATRGERNWNVSREDAKKILNCAASTGTPRIKEAANKALRMF